MGIAAILLLGMGGALTMSMTALDKGCLLYTSDAADE